MPQYDFVAPGAMASEAIIRELARRKAEERQALLDSILQRDRDSQIAEREARSKREDISTQSEVETRKATVENAKATGQRAAAEIIPRGTELNPELEEALGPYAANSEKTYGVLSGSDPNMQGPTEKKTYKGTAKQEQADETLEMRKFIAQMQNDMKAEALRIQEMVQTGKMNDAQARLALQEANLALRERMANLDSELKGLKITGERQKIDDAAKQTKARRDAALGLADEMRRSIGDLITLGPDGQPVLDANKKPQLTKGASDIVGGSRWSMGLPEIMGGKGMLPGAIAEKIPGTDQATARAALKQTIGEQVIELMKEMKEQSKTGATGFGALSEKELDLLQSAAARLDTAQNDEAFARELVHINSLLDKVYQEQENSVTVPTSPASPADTPAKSKYKVTIENQ